MGGNPREMNKICSAFRFFIDVYDIDLDDARKIVSPIKPRVQP